MSPSAVTIGVATESRSHPRRYYSTDTARVIPRISSDPSAPPMIEITARCRTGIDSCPNAADAIRARYRTGLSSILEVLTTEQALAQAEGALKHRIAATFPLRELAKAHAFAESHTGTGHVVVEIE